MVENINELAIIFKRQKDEEEMVETFIPYKITEGAYYEEMDAFVDVDQNVYFHIAGTNDIGAVYGSRVAIYDMLKDNTSKSLDDIKRDLLDTVQKYTFYKSVDENSDDYGLVFMKNNEDESIIAFEDEDTQGWYSFFGHDEDSNSEKSSTKNTKETREEQKKEDSKNVYKTPRELVEAIKKTIKGQDDAVKAIVTVIWKWLYYPEIPKSNMLLIGPTASGKTKIMEKLSKLLDVPMVVHAIPGTSQAGYKGADLVECIKKLYYASNCDIAKTEKGIIVLDEFDKLGNNHETGEVGTTAVQNELLKLIEGTTISFEVGPFGGEVYVNTANILFDCNGAFTELFDQHVRRLIGFGDRGWSNATTKVTKITPEMIINQGIMRELVGRLPVIVQLNDISKNKPVLKDIIINCDESVLLANIESLKKQGIEVENFDKVIDAIVDDASSKGTGARGLISTASKVFDSAIYEASNEPGKYEKLILGENILENAMDFELVPKKTKTRTRKKVEENQATM